MSKTGFFTLFQFLLIWSGLLAEEKIIRLNLNESYNYVFEHQEQIYGIRDDGARIYKSVKTKEIKLSVRQVIPNEKIIFELQYLKNIHDRESRDSILNRTDYFYPDFREQPVIFTSVSDMVEPLLCRSVLHFSLDLNTGELNLLNRVGLLEQFYQRLSDQQLDNETIKSYLDSINHRKYLIDPDLVMFLTWFNNARYDKDSLFVGKETVKKVSVKDQQGVYLNLGDQNSEKIISGKTIRNYRINTETGIIDHYSFLRHDSVVSRFELLYSHVKWQVKQEEFRFLYSQKIPENTLHISGKIENPLSNKVHIRFLDDPFDAVLKTHTVLLDDDGSFVANPGFSHAGFVYMENENNNKFQPPLTFLFYTEPGDTLGFESFLEDSLRSVRFSGNRITEQKLIFELRRKLKYENFSRRVSNYPNEIFDRDILFLLRPDGEVDLNKIPDMLFDAIYKAEEIISGYQGTISECSYRFILNETKAFFYGGIFQYGWLFSGGYLYFGFRQQNLVDPEIFDEIDQLDVHKVYNDYGLYSRQGISHYLNYHSSRVTKVHYRYMRGTGNYHVPDEPERDFQFSRMILTGAPLYRETGKNLLKILENNPSPVYSGFISSRESQTDYVIKKFDLMLRNCNDREMADKIHQVITQNKKLQTGNYIPEISFLDEYQRKVTFRDFTGGKPAIFYISSDWTGNRYEYDIMAEGMPGIRFVMVTEGNNFTQWLDYKKLAEPVATHLFYRNDTLSFRDIFQKPSLFLVFDNKGNLVTTADNPKEAAKKAMESSGTKNELNKSQLIKIIAIMGAILAALVTFLILWRWRTRKRFKKELEQRRLRELELTAIRSQMNPHFLFNCLNSVQNLIQQNKGREAHLYLSDFAGLIRKVLHHSEKEEVSLAEELEMTEQYLKLEKLRFEFEFLIQVEEGVDIYNTMVPSVVLQPIAENAIVHGLQNKPGEKQLKILVIKAQINKYPEITDNLNINSTGYKRIKGLENGILIRIEDNGIGRKAAWEMSDNHNGKATKLIGERFLALQKKHKVSYRMEVTDLDENGQTGTRVEIFIPDEN